MDFYVSRVHQRILVEPTDNSQRWTGVLRSAERGEPGKNTFHRELGELNQKFKQNDLVLSGFLKFHFRFFNDFFGMKRETPATNGTLKMYR